MPEQVHNSAAAMDDDNAPLWTPRFRQRLTLIAIGALLIVLMVVLPPYISISRYQRRVQTAISDVLGRPSHFSSIALHLLPLPGLTIKYLVVDELPAYGSEPVLVADTVEARLRVSSLWRRRIEVSRISLDSPSINLVRKTDGSGWNLQSILLQASQMNSAPTAQPRAGEAPRFPYIEATDARLNIKNGDDKLPFSLKEAEFALWLPEPGHWRLRVNGRPVRTDTDVSDVGVMRMEATLGRAVAGGSIASAPIELSASWKPTPMGEAAKLTLGYDTGWRGEVSGDLALKGTLGNAKLTTDMHLLALRRADFVPGHTTEVNAHCEATASGLLRSLHDIRCAIPTNMDTSMLAAIDLLRRFPEPSTAASGDPASGKNMPDQAAKPGVWLIRGEIPNVLDGRTVNLQATLKQASANYALAWARLFSHRIPQDLSVAGTIDLTAWKENTGPDSSRWGGTLVCDCTLPPAKASASDEVSPRNSNRWNLVLTSGGHGDDANAPNSTIALHAYRLAQSAGPETSAEHTLEPANPEDTVSGEVDRNGYTLIYGSESAVRDAARFLPPLADAIPADATGALQVSRAWNGDQTWKAATAAPAAHKPQARRRLTATQR